MLDPCKLTQDCVFILQGLRKVPCQGSDDGIDECINIMSQPVLWVVHGHTNKCRSVQLLGHRIVPYEIYHLINCVHYLLYFHVSHALY